jgi:uncharacterized protein YdhG (YjbR/CyaY superfamily)
MRATIRAAAPDAVEAFSYGMPAFALKGNLVYFGAAKQHIGFYPTPSGITAFQEALASYKGAKGSVQFAHDQPLPLELVAQIVRFRVEENLAAAQAKATKRRGSASSGEKQD